MITKINEFKKLLESRLIIESMGDISRDEINTEKFNNDLAKQLDLLFEREDVHSANWAGIKAWNISGDSSDGYFVIDAVSYKGGNIYNNIDYEIVHKYEDDNLDTQSEVLHSLNKITDPTDFLEIAKSYIGTINEMSDFDAVANIGKINKQITIEIDLKHSMHSMERQGRSTEFIKNSDIKATVDSATPQIADLLMNNTLNVGDPIYIFNKTTNLNIVGSLTYSKFNDKYMFKLITVMISADFYNKNKTYKVTVE